MNMKRNEEQPFWKKTALGDMTAGEWESLCDGCGRCCLHKLEDIDSGETSQTNVACRLLNLGTCQCSKYEDRKKYVPDCLILDVVNITELHWMPPTCAYRQLAEGRELSWWHPLVSGDPETVHQAGISVRSMAITERKAGALEHHLIDPWPEDRGEESGESQNEN